MTKKSESDQSMSERLAKLRERMEKLPKLPPIPEWQKDGNMISLKAILKELSDHIRLIENHVDIASGDIEHYQNNVDEGTYRRTESRELKNKIDNAMAINGYYACLLGGYDDSIHYFARDFDGCDFSFRDLDRLHAVEEKINKLDDIYQQLAKKIGEEVVVSGSWAYIISKAYQSRVSAVMDSYDKLCKREIDRMKKEDDWTHGDEDG